MSDWSLKQTCDSYLDYSSCRGHHGFGGDRRRIRCGQRGDTSDVGDGEGDKTGKCREQSGEPVVEHSCENNDEERNLEVKISTERYRKKHNI